jgi:hypothetical protein
MLGIELAQSCIQVGGGGASKTVNANDPRLPKSRIRVLRLPESEVRKYSASSPPESVVNGFLAGVIERNSFGSASLQIADHFECYQNPG